MWGYHPLFFFSIPRYCTLPGYHLFFFFPIPRHNLLPGYHPLFFFPIPRYCSLPGYHSLFFLLIPRHNLLPGYLTHSFFPIPRNIFPNKIFLLFPPTCPTTSFFITHILPHHAFIKTRHLSTHSYNKRIFFPLHKTRRIAYGNPPVTIRPSFNSFLMKLIITAFHHIQGSRCSHHNFLSS